MTIEEINKIIQPFIEEPIVSFDIQSQVFIEANGRKQYNNIIREKVKLKFGVYIWINKITSEIIYIGMAGKLKTDGSHGSHSIQDRLLASRGKDKDSLKEIQTNDYVRDSMLKHEIEILSFYILYSKNNEPPAYIEALLLYNFYKKNKRLPKLNDSF